MNLKRLVLSLMLTAGLCLAALATPASQAEQALSQLQALQKQLSAIPAGGKPSTKLLAAHKNEIVFSEPSGQWLVRAEAFWKLRDRFAKDPAAERIAWAAATQPLPGECEADACCHLSLEKLTDGRYLELYPAGRHATEALERMSKLLTMLTNDTQGVFEYPRETPDVAEMHHTITYLRRVVAGAAPSMRQRVLQQLDKVSSRVP